VTAEVRLQPLVRGKVAALGETGRAWQESLPRVLGELAERWSLRVGRGLPGGSASYVCEAVTAAGDPAVLKVVVPDPALADEARVLEAARGRGHVRLHAHDPERRALLLERLGGSLDRSTLPPEARLDVAVDVLARAWTVPVEAGPPATDRAAHLADGVRAAAADHPGACPPAVLRAALACADRRSGAGDPARHLLCHGDPHPANLLAVRAPRPGAEPGWVLVDPDGVRCEPAYDAGVLLRDWSSHLQGPDARRTHEEWVRRVADRADLDPAAVRDWAYLGRVSTGLYLHTLGADRLARTFLDSAAALAPGPG